MTFELKYKDNENPLWDGLVRTEFLNKCVCCGKPTHFIELNSEEYLCSEECVEKFYNKKS